MKQATSTKGTTRGKVLPKPPAKKDAGNGKGNGKAEVVSKHPKHPLGVSNADILTMDRKALAALCVKTVGSEPHYAIPDAFVKVFLTNLNNGMDKEAAMNGLRKMVEDAKKGKPVDTGKPAPPAEHKAPPAPPKAAPPKAATAPPRREVSIPVQIAREPVAADVPGTATSVADYPVDYLIEAIVEKLLRPFTFFFNSLVENEKSKKNDAAVQKEWDKHFPGYKVDEIREAFNARLSTLRVPPMLAKEVPARFNRF